MCKRLDLQTTRLSTYYTQESQEAQEQKNITNTNEVHATLEITTRFENQQETIIQNPLRHIQ